MNKSEYQTKSVIGIDISDSSMEACEIYRDTEGFSILAASRVEVGLGILDKGIIKRKKQFQVALDILLKNPKEAKFQSNEVVVSIPESAVYLYTEESQETIDKSKVNSIIQNELRDVIPEDLESKIIHHEIVKGKYKNRIIVKVVDKQIVEDLVKAFNEAKYNVIGVELESEAKARSLIQEIPQNEGIMLVDIGTDDTSISVFDNLGISLSTTIPYGGKLFTEVIAESVKISIKEAEDIKRTYGLMNGESLSRYRDDLVDLIDKIHKEIKETLHYYQASTGRKVLKVKLCGGSSQMKGLIEFFASNIDKIEFEKGVSWLSCRCIEEADRSLFVSASGLALKGLDYNDSFERGNLLIASNVKKIKSRAVKSGLFGKFANAFGKKKPKKKDIEITKKVDEDNEVKNNLRLSNDYEVKRKPLLEDNGKEKEGNGKKKLLYVLAALVIVLSYGFFGYTLFEAPQNRETFSKDTIALTDSTTVYLADMVKDESEYQIITGVLPKEYTFDSTGLSGDSSVIKGIITIENKTGDTYNLVPTTRLESKDGNIYRIDSSVNIEPGEKVDTEIRADEEGAKYEMDIGEKLTFPGLPGFDEFIFATTKSGFKAESTPFVTEKDLKSAKEEIIKSIESLEIKDINWGTEEGLVLSTNSFDKELKSIKFNAKEGDKVEDFSADVQFTIYKIGTSMEVLSIIIQDKVLPGYEINQCTFDIDSFDQEEDKAEVNISCIAFSEVR